MNEYEIVFQSANSIHYPKRITALIVAPRRIDEQTGIMHFAHGWGGNRFAYQKAQREFAELYNLICVATEYRQSGYEADPVVGRGVVWPYDASHYQVLDCINAVRRTLELYPGVNRRRLIAFGGSQGGHIAMLMAIFCPSTFAFVISASMLAYVDEERRRGWVGRDFSDDELAVRDVIRMAARVRCPVALIHGTADEVVSDTHTRLLEKALREQGREVRVRYVEGGEHSLGPGADRTTVAAELAGDWLRTLVNPKATDFELESRIEIPCVRKTCVLDWSKPPADSALVSWIEKTP